MKKHANGGHPPKLFQLFFDPPCMHLIAALIEHDHLDKLLMQIQTDRTPLELPALPL
jgi:hypothetical protein